MTKQEETLINYEKLLRGYYEAGNLPKDFSPDRIVPDFGFNVLNMRGLLYTPIIDEHYLSSGGRRPAWPDGKSFAVCLTHDVDVVSPYSLRESLKARWSQIKKNPLVLKRIENLLGLGFDWFRYIGGKKTIHCYELWIKVESEIDACSTFFFSPGTQSIKKTNHTDCQYNLRDT